MRAQRRSSAGRRCRQDVEIAEYGQLKLRRYLDRIGYRGDARPTASTLASVLRLHACSVAFENIDVQLGRPLTINVQDAFEKIVDRGRGGWCYEQNGLFGWALAELGFEVMRISGAVRREERGDAALNNHLFLLVREPGVRHPVYLADVGFGGSMIAPIELAESEHSQAPYRIRLQFFEEGYWRLFEESADGTSNYEFVAKRADEAALAARCEQLQTDPQSGFVRNLVVQKRLPDAHVCLRGRVLATTTATARQTVLLESAEELATTVSELCGMDVPGVAELWPRVVARHEEWSEN